jgi:hypothetical protein
MMNLNTNILAFLVGKAQKNLKEPLVFMKELVGKMNPIGTKSCP